MKAYIDQTTEFYVTFVHKACVQSTGNQRNNENEPLSNYGVFGFSFVEDYCLKRFTFQVKLQETSQAIWLKTYNWKEVQDMYTSVLFCEDL